MFPFHDNNPVVRSPFVTIVLIVANVLAFLWLINLPNDRARETAVVQRGFIPARLAQLSNPNLIINVDLDEQEKEDIPQIRQAPPLRFQLPPDRKEILSSLVTAMFLHGGWMHLLGNMWFLWLFGNNIEDRLGHFVFTCFYLIGGVFASLCHWLYDPASAVPVIGASGAVAAVLGAYAVTFPKARVKCLVFLIIFVTIIELPALVVLGIWFAGQLLDAMGSVHLGLDGGVAFWAHVGGFISGAVLMPLLAAGAPPPGRAWHDEAREAFDYGSGAAR